MKIALIGTRGIPAAHGGFETCVEEVGARLVRDFGCEVTVYSKRNPKFEDLREYKGAKIVYVPWLGIKGFETLVATFFSVVHSLFCRYDMHMIFNAANSFALFPYFLFGKKFALNTDGLEWQRDKWGFWGKNYYKLSEKMAKWICPNLVSDSQGIYNYYKSRHGVESTIIAYGANFPDQYSPEDIDAVLKKYGVKAGEYCLQVTRFEPENNPLLTAKVMGQFPDLKCVIVGGAARANQYSTSIVEESQKSSNVILPGFIYDKKTLDILWSHCLFYVHGNGVGGTNPALLQAMAAGRPIVSYDCNFNRETLAEQAFFFDRNLESMENAIRSLLNQREQAEAFALSSKNRIREVFSWEKISKQYYELFANIRGYRNGK